MSETHNSPATNSETITVSATPTLLNVNMTNVTKLTGSNFLMWSRQVLALLDGYDLAGYIEGSIVVPPPTTTTDDEITTNPSYTLWKRQDHLIFSALLGAITPTIQPILSTATTAAEIWTTLTTTYAKPSRAHVKQIREQIQTWKKGEKLINDYFQGLTTRFDEIALLGKAMDHEDQIEAILVGLPEEYKTIADQIDGRETPPSLPEIHEKLLNQEAKLQAASSVTTPAPITANYTNSRGSSSYNRNQNSRRGGYRGHQTWQQQQLTASSPQLNTNSSRGYQGKCQICSVFGHSARRCPQLHGGSTAHVTNPPSWQPRANVAQANLYNPNAWLLDSGATHHLTSDLQNLALHQPYTGGDEVAIADGTGEGSQHGGPVASRPHEG
ncbi:unnamed protein product [Brassica rapa subsp. trilocularis]